MVKTFNVKAKPTPTPLPPAKPPPKANTLLPSVAVIDTSPVDALVATALLTRASVELPKKFSPKVPPIPAPPTFVDAPIEPVTETISLFVFASTVRPL